MATPISRNILNQETNARFWAQSGYKVGQRLDPKNPLDKAKMPVWMDIFRKVSAEADAGTLVTTYDRVEVAQPLADAEIASAVAAMHVDEAAKSPDPTTAQQHASAAATATQVVAQKLIEAASNQRPTVSPKLEQDAAREAAKTPPPPHAPAVDQIAHAQMQNGQNEKLLRPEQDPWDSRYVPPPTSKSPREQPPAQPSKSPPPEILYKETNARFWNRTRYKPGQKLDMSDPQDRSMSKTWMDILQEVEREANEGRLTFTSPELVAPDGARPPPPRSMQPRPTSPAPMQQPMPPPMQPPRQPGMQQPMQPSMQPWPSPGMQQPGMQPWPPPGMQQPWSPPGMQRPMPPGMQRPGMEQPGMQPWPPPGMQRPMPPPGMQRPGMQPWPPPGMQQPMQPGMQPDMQPPMRPGMQPPMPSAPSEGPPPPSPMEGAPMPPIEPTTEGAPAEAGMSKGKIALIVLGLAGAAGIAYAVTRKPAPVGRTVSFRPRSKSTMATGAPSFAFSPARGGRS